MKATKLETVTWHLILDACPNHIKVQIPSLESQARAVLSMMRLKQSNDRAAYCKRPYYYYEQ